MTRKIRVPAPTIAHMLKLQAALEAKATAHYAASTKYSDYKDRVKELGAGYAEGVEGVMYVIAITPNKFGNGTEMTLVEVKNR